MSGTLIGTIGLLALFVLLVLRMPVAMAMLVVGFVGTVAMNGLNAAFATLSGETFEFSTFYALLVVPLFILMGNLAGVSGMSRDLYGAAYAWFGHWRAAWHRRRSPAAPGSPR